MKSRNLYLFLTALTIVAALVLSLPAGAGSTGATGDLKVLAPISQGRLTIFPIVAAGSRDTSQFLTLDEGLRSGEVVVTEAGRVQGLIRRPGTTSVLPERGGGAEVNRLVLVNNSDRPLLLLAGEIVTGGKQDRVIGKDRIVPPKSDPIDLSVFCVEPGRWTGASMKFGGVGMPMAQPSVRAGAMSAKNQQKVWSEVRRSQAEMAAAAPAAAGEIGSTTSYATVIANDEVKRRMDSAIGGSGGDYQGIIRELRQRGAVGVVVAVGSEIIWADVFASPALLEKYWPKLARSYAAEALSRRNAGKPETADAQKFLDQRSGTRELVESEPGVFRHTEVIGSGYRAFELTSLLPKTGFDLHVAKMAE